MVEGETRTRSASRRRWPHSSTSPFTNLSSIVVLAEAEGKRMLLTGDARGDKVLGGLEIVGLLTASGDTMHVDVLRCPHHGSANNIETISSRRVTADHYVFSGNGEHGNPERETMEMLFEARGMPPLTMDFTYPVDEIDVERKEDWEKEQAKEIAKGKSAEARLVSRKEQLAQFLRHPPARHWPAHCRDSGNRWRSSVDESYWIH